MIDNIRISDERFDRNMSRPCEYGALDFFLEQTEAANAIVSKELVDRIFGSIGSNVQIPVINYDGEVSVGNVRSCTIADNANTSALYTVNFVTYAVGFSMVPAAYHNNSISYEQDFRRKLEKVSRALANALDKAAVAALEANKTQVFADELQYTVTGNVVEVPAQMRTEILGDLDPMMRANCYPAPLHIVGNAGVDSLARKLYQHGEFNDVDKRLEMAGKVFHFTNNVTNEAGKNGTLFAVADGNVAALTRVDRESLMRTSLGDVDEWDVVRLPFIDLPVGSHYSRAKGDWSATDGAATADLTCGIKEYFGFSVDVAFVVAYNSDPETVANPIIKVEMDSLQNNEPIAIPVRVVGGTVPEV